MTPSVRLTAAVLDTPDPQGLARFYQRLLGWPIRDDDPEWATLRPEDGGWACPSSAPPGTSPPVWPAEPGAQQMQLHLDFQVDDLAAASALAERAGARRFGGHTGEDVHVHAESAGHPFCLFQRLR